MTEVRETWRANRDTALARTIAELREIGAREVVPHSESLRAWRRERDEAIGRALITWTRRELSHAEIAELVGCTKQRVQQIDKEGR
jgi:hypothetical protein